MHLIYRECPIAAISTATSSKAALGIIRFSGFKNLDFIFKTSNLSKIETRKATLLRIYDQNSELLDEGLALYFEAPHSFTGENILELHLHGNPLNLVRILEFYCEFYSFERAMPGEFSYRALKNKKLNLTQVEGLDLLLNANSAFGLSSASKILNNELYEQYNLLREAYLKWRASVEILIDFSEDMGEKEAELNYHEGFNNFTDILNKLYKRTQVPMDSLLNPKISLFGKTNAGKSTLFNKILGHNRSIVSAIEGTTRDYISETILIDGVSYQLIDTAGIRESSDVIEMEGLKKAKEIINNSFIKLLVINPFDDYSNDYDSITFDAIVFTNSDRDGFSERLKLYKSISSATCFCSSLLENYFPFIDIKSFNGGPIGAASEIGSIGAHSNSGPMGAKSESGSIGAISNSGPIGAKSENGSIGAVRDLNRFISVQYQQLTKTNPIPISRHKDVISDIYRCIEDSGLIWSDLSDMGLLSNEINGLSRIIDELIGIVYPDDVLGDIFDNFCIGK